MKLVAQEDALGCGIACVASCVGDNYGDVISKVSNPAKASISGFMCKDLIMILETYGRAYCLKYAPRYKLLFPVGSIIYTRRDNRYTAGHFVVLTANGWMNPWSNYPNWPAVAEYEDKLCGEAQYAIIPK